MQPDEQNSGTASSGRQHAAEILLIVLIFLALAGDPAPNVNEPHYLCQAKHYWNPDWCPGDLFLESPPAHRLFIIAFGWVTKWLTLTQTAWLGRIVVWSLLAWAWQRLSWRVIPLRWCACLSAALFVVLMGWFDLAGEWVVGGVEAKCFAYVFVLLALDAMLCGRWNLVLISLGAASALHVLVGGWSILACGGVWLVCDRKPSPLSLIPGMIAGGSLALLGAVPALSLSWNEPPDLVAEAHRVYVFERLPHHLAPLTLPSEQIARALVAHGILLLLLLVLWRRIASSSLAVTNRLALWKLGWFAAFAALFAAAGLVIELALWNHPRLAADLLRYYWFRLTDVAAPMAVALMTVAAMAHGIERQRTASVCALAALLAVTGWQIATSTYERTVHPVPPADHAMRDYTAWVDACQWVADNTSEDSFFLPPRRAQSFKWRTGRPEVVTHKDIPQDTRSIIEWFHRYRDVHFFGDTNSAVPVRSLGHVGTRRVKQLASKYQADYILTDRRRRLDLPAVYANHGYIVYATETEHESATDATEGRGL